MTLKDPTPIRLVNHLFLALLCFAIPIYSGCKRGNSIEEVQLLKIRQLATKVKLGYVNHANGFVPIFENKQLRFIVGGTEHERIAAYTDLSAISADGNIGWTLDATCSVNNPRPYEGKAAPQNDWEFLPETAVNIGDVTGDEVDDLYVTNGVHTSHAGIVSGVDGRLVVQSMVESHHRKNNKQYWPLRMPAVVFDLDQDGVKDLRFVFPHDGGYQSVTLSGKHLGQIDQQHVAYGGLAFGVAITQWKDETGDGVSEFVVYDRRNRGQTVDQLIIVDGKSLQVLRRLTEMNMGSVGAIKRFFIAGDINGDGCDDIGMTSRHGAKGNQDNGLVTVFSGKDGAAIWYIGAEALGGPQSELITATRGKGVSTNLFVDNKLGDSVALAPDQNGDGIYEIVVPLTLSSKDTQQRTLVMLSGADGSVMKKKTLSKAHVIGDLIPLTHRDAAGETPIFGMFGSRDRKNGGMIKFSF